MLYIRSPCLIYNWKVVIFKPPSSISPTPSPQASGNHQSVLSMCLGSFFFNIPQEMKSYGICLSLTYFTNALKAHSCYHKWQDFILFNG